MNFSAWAQGYAAPRHFLTAGFHRPSEVDMKLALGKHDKSHSTCRRGTEDYSKTEIPVQDTLVLYP